MRTEDAISSLKFIKSSFTGDCTTNTLVPISRVDVEALNIAIKSLEILEFAKRILQFAVEHTEGETKDHYQRALNLLIKENKQ